MQKDYLVSVGLARLSNTQIGKLAREVLAPFYAKPSRRQMQQHLETYHPELDRNERLVVIQRAERLANDKEQYHPLPARQPVVVSRRPAAAPAPPPNTNGGPVLTPEQREVLRAATIELLRGNRSVQCTVAHRALGEPAGIGYSSYYEWYFRPAREAVDLEPRPVEHPEPVDPWAVLQRIANRRPSHQDGGAAFHRCRLEAQAALERRAREMAAGGAAAWGGADEGR